MATLIKSLSEEEEEVSFHFPKKPNIFPFSCRSDLLKLAKTLNLQIYPVVFESTTLRIFWSHSLMKGKSG
jgi:hypothetical protein